MFSTKVKLQKSSAFTFAVGKIRVLESKLLEEAVFYQLADSRTAKSLESVLNTTDYGKEISIPDFDETISQKETSTLYGLKNLVEDYRFLLPFFCKRDFHNLKLIAKSKFTEIEEGWLKEGLLKKEIILKSIIEKNLSSLPEHYSGYVEEARDIYDKTNQWQLIDSQLDRRLYEQILKVTQGKELHFVEQFFKTEIDLVNINSFIRCKNRGISTDSFAQFFIEGGFLEKSLIIYLYEQSVDKLADKLKFTPYYILADEGIPFLKETGKFYRITQSSCSILLNYLSCAKYTAFGYEPLLRYLFLKMNELRNLRAIFAGKLQGAKPEEIKDNIGPFSS